MRAVLTRIFFFIRTLFRRTVEFVFGEIQWRPPIWLRPIFRFSQAHAILVLSIGFVICAGTIGAYLYLHQPQPEFTEITVTAPHITPLEKELKPQPVSISFSQSAAPLGKIGSLVQLQMTPHIDGQWKWTDHRTLTFQPSADWPPGTTYKVSLPAAELAKDIRLKDNSVEFTTRTLEVKIQDAQFYQDPVTVEKRQVIATIESNFPIELDTLRRFVSFDVLGDSKLFGANQPFEVVADLHQRRFFLRSANITLPDREDFVRLAVRQGLPSETGASKTAQDEIAKVRVPDKYSFFHVEQVTATTAQKDNGDVIQLVVVETSVNTSPQEIASGIEVWLLPNKQNADDSSDSSDSNDDSSTESEDKTERNQTWKSPGEITDEVLKAAQKLQVTLQPEKEKFSKEHLFRCSFTKGGQLFVKLSKDTPAVGGYLLADDFRALVNVPALGREIEVQGKGGILALSGERTLSVVTRGVQHVEFEIAKVLPNQINHLVTQTSGSFSKLEFLGDNFDENNITVISRPTLVIADESDGTAKYSSLNLDPYLLVNGRIEHGLFFLHPYATDPKTHKTLTSHTENRFILVTDLGILTKRNTDKSREIFVVSLKDQTSISGVHVSLLAKNGLPLFEGATDNNGHLHAPALDEPQNERQPAAIIAQLGDDLSFIPYEREDNLVDFSSFEIDGEVSPGANAVEVFPFTDRGIYRPGETIHVGLIVRSQHNQNAEVPLLVDIDDPSGESVASEEVKAAGLAETEIELPATAATGEYHLTVHLQNKDKTLVTEEYFHVEEFQPDRMKISAGLESTQHAAWINPEQLRVNVHLENLFGTAAVGNRIAAKQKVSPGGFQLESWKDFTFFNPSIYPETHPEYGESQDLADATADQQGNVLVSADLSKYANACYRVDLDIEGFEADGGRSVHTQFDAIVSDRDFVLGYRTTAELTFLPFNHPAFIDLLAVAKTNNVIGLTNLRFRLIEKRKEPVLTKQENGTFKYEAVDQEAKIQEGSLNLPAAATGFSLPTDKVGNFRLELVDENDNRLFSLDYTVVGSNRENPALGEKTDLRLTLSKKSVKPGEELQLSLQAPYDGYGLITVEREKTVAWKWFQAAHGASIQTITIPADFEGFGYINVSFVRSLNAPEVYTSPLSYAVAPFRCIPSQRRINLTLEVPKTAKPGEKLAIKLRADRPCKAVIYAVDIGILQISDYETPDPVAWRYRKRQLEVQTYQILESLLPEYSKLKRAAAAGGGDEHVEKNLNPFTRVTEKPVVFWSGIVSANVQPTEVDYVVPEFFDGSVRVMAVAEAVDGEGSTQSDAAIHGPIIITPQAPLFAAPGDEFLTTATVTNATENTLSSDVTLEVEGGLKVFDTDKQTVNLRAGASQTLRWKVRVTDTLGNAVIRFVATAPAESVHRQRTLSVRPAAPYLTRVDSGKLDNGKKEIDLTQEFYAQFESRTAAESNTPLVLINGLHKFLDAYPYDCSEQLTSRAFANLVLALLPGSNLNKAQLATKLQSYFKIIRERQGSDGAVGYWSSDDANELDPLSVYVLEFLTDAKTAGIVIPSDIDKAGLNYLKSVAGTEPSSVDEAETVAKAIYLLTRRENVMTNELVNLRETLDRKFPDTWKESLAGVYMAGSAALLMKERDANEWISHYRLHQKPSGAELKSSLGDDAQYLMVLARHFPQRFRSLKAEQIDQVLKPILAGDYNTISAAQCLRALGAGQTLFNRNQGTVQISQWTGAWKLISPPPSGTATVSNDATRVKFESGQNGAGYYQMIQNGYPKSVRPSQQGLEIERDFLDEKSQPTTVFRAGDQMTIRIRIRSTAGTPIANVAIVDLLPSGFEPVRGKDGRVELDGAEVNYSDTREDRVLIYLTAGTDVAEITYKAKATVAGKLIVPPILAQAMYNRQVQATGQTGQIEVRTP